MKKSTRRIAMSIAALTATIGLVAMPAPGHADTGWGWRVAPGAHGGK